MTAYNSVKACSRRIRELEIEVKKLKQQDYDYATIFRKQARIKFFKERRQRLAQKKTRKHGASNMKSATNITAQLKECGIYIRALRDDKWQAVDYTKLQPDEVQELERWDEKGWYTILDGVSGALGQTLDKAKTPREQARNSIIAILILLKAVTEIDIT